MTSSMKTISDTSRDRCATLERYLYLLHPHKSFFIVPELLQIFFCVDISLYRIAIDWLKPAFGWSKAASIVHSSVQEMSCPLSFTVADDDRQCISAVSYESATNTALSADSISAVVPEIIRVPFTSSNGSVEGMVRAVIYVGDLLKLRSSSSIIWEVFEINPLSKVVILAVHKRSELRNRQFITKQSTSAKGSIPRDGKFHIVEKRNFVAAELMGAVVWREEVTAENIHCSKIADADTVDDSGPVVSSDSCVGFQMPTSPWELVLERMKSLVRKHVLLYGEAKMNDSQSKQLLLEEELNCRGNSTNNVAPYSKRGRLTRVDTATSALISGFENKSRDKRIGRDKIAEHRPSMTDDDAPAALRGLNKENTFQAQMWLTKEKDLLRARLLLLTADPFSCCLASCRDYWILTCRALKAICRGDEDLLNNFYSWTYSAGLEGEIRAKDCGNIWRSLRPLTTADLPCVAQARVYIRASLSAKNMDESVQEEQLTSGRDIGSPSWQSIDASCRGDPQLKSLIDSAGAVLKGRSLFFLSSINDGSITNIAHLPDGHIIVPAAMYEVGESTSAGEDIKSYDQNERGVASPSTALLKTGEVVAKISPGDVLLLPSFQSCSPNCGRTPEHNSQQFVDFSYSRERKSTWHRVIAIDLLYARLRVSPCPPPPDCWNRHVTLPSVWAPISCLWAVSVCQLMPLMSPQSCLHVQYIVYLTPIPSISASFAALASLPRKDKKLSSASRITTLVENIKKVKLKKPRSKVPP